MFGSNTQFKGVIHMSLMELSSQMRKYSTSDFFDEFAKKDEKFESLRYKNTFGKKQAKELVLNFIDEFGKEAV